MVFQYIKKLMVVAAIVLFQFSILGTALAQQRGTDLDRTSPTPRLDDGKVDFGGDGVWNLPYIRNFADRIVGGDENSSVPFLPWTEAMHEYNASNRVAYDPEGFCLPPGGPRSMGTPYPAEIIQHRDRIIIIFEGGGHVWRLSLIHI